MVTTAEGGFTNLYKFYPPDGFQFLQVRQEPSEIPAPAMIGKARKIAPGVIVEFFYRLDVDTQQLRLRHEVEEEAQMQSAELFKGVDGEHRPL